MYTHTCNIHIHIYVLFTQTSPMRRPCFDEIYIKPSKSVISSELSYGSDNSLYDNFSQRVYARDKYCCIFCNNNDRTAVKVSSFIP